MSKQTEHSAQVYPVLVSTDSTGRVVVDISGKQYAYQIDGARIDMLKRGWKHSPWKTFRDYLKGREVA